MAHRLEESDLLIQPVSSREAQSSLLSPMSESPRSLSFFSQLSCLSCKICFKSKSALLVLVWNVYVGALYTCLLDVFTVAGFMWQNQQKYPAEGEKFNVVIWTVLSAYALLALTLLLYPVSGFLADVYCGRYKAVSISFVILWVSMLICSAILVMSYFEDKTDWGIEPLKYVIALLVVVGLTMMIVGLASYQANIIQLGLDQLLEAPSEKLGVFVHWLMWSHNFGSTFVLVTFTIFPCYSYIKAMIYFIGSVPFVLLFISTLLLSFTCYNHDWFYTEPAQSNPYKTVFKVLNFARKNKYPLRRSAFTFCDDFIPSRIDFAKERYGGPFTTPQVEDVKTFLRIVSVLLALGPVFVLEVAGSNYLLPLFALHTSNKLQFYGVGDDIHCQSSAVWLIVQNGTIGFIVSILLTPLYIWVVYSLLRRRIPKIFSRLTFSLVLFLSGVIYLLVTDLIGHGISHHSNHHSNNSMCLFTTIYSDIKRDHLILNMHWSVSIPPSILLTLGCLLIHATALEFISAQSPHSMKGLLVGVFFAIKGLFQFISAAAVVPFAIPGIWNSINAVTNCGFGYYLFTIVVALIGLVVFSVVVRRYRYRERDERPFDTRFAERYYERYLGSSVGRETRSSINDEATSEEEDQNLIQSSISLSSKSMNKEIAT